MKRIACVWLKAWSVDRFKRHQRGLWRKPLVLVQTSGARITVAAACPLARASGVRTGISLAEARTLSQGLHDAPHDPSKDARALQALGHWLMRFTPVVALERPDALFLDLSGCERLFGGIHRLRQQIEQAMHRLRISANVAVAPTPGAAWALALAGNALPIVGSEQLVAALRPLPPDCLRLDGKLSAILHHLGIATIGHLIDLPRYTLPARFGEQLLLRLDQATGNAPEPLNPLTPRSPVRATIRFEAALDSLETIWIALQQLLDHITLDLRQRGCGARQLHVHFERDGSSPLEQTVLLSRPSRHPGNLFNLLRCALEAVQTNAGFTAIMLSVPVLEPLPEEQIHLLGQAEYEADRETARLTERLRARLGAANVEVVRLIESHVPERACRYVEAVDLGAPRSGIVEKAHEAEAIDRCLPLLTRPLLLLPHPVEIAVLVTPSEDREGQPVSFAHGGTSHSIGYAIGPERIAGIWWDGHNKTRDYFEVEDQDGRRFWIFRVVQTTRWFLHGHFA